MTAFPELAGRVGEVIGRTEPVTISQSRIDAFAEVTDDHQWIHVDPSRARREGPHGSTVAHGLLTLSLVPALLLSCLPPVGVRLTVNYGLDRVRFPAPVVAGSTVVMVATLNAYRDIEGGAQLVIGFQVSVPGGARPSVVGEIVLNLYK